MVSSFTMIAVVTILSILYFQQLLLCDAFKGINSWRQTSKHPIKDIAQYRWRKQLQLQDLGTVTDAVSDPQNANFLSDTVDATVDSFFGSFRSRLLGAVLGNLLAGFVFKQIADFIYNLLNPPPKESAVNSQTAAKESIGGSAFEPMKGKEVPPISMQAWLKLVLCAVIDLAGDASFLVPGIGEAEDIAWAPLSAFIMKNLFNSDRVAVAEFFKEILPFTDIIPLATTLWIFENVLVDSPVNKLLGVTSSAEKENKS